MLDVRDLHAYYGKSHILQGVNITVGDNEIVSILGRNGVGRSTTLKAIMGDPVPRGEVIFKDRPIAGLKPHEIARRGIGYVPEERAIFPTLTVAQNLLLGVKSGQTAKRWSVDETWRLFPQLRDRADAPGGALSGGEQQMLTICRTLMGDPRSDHDRRAHRGSRAADGRTYRRAFAGDRTARHFHSAGRAAPGHRLAHLPSRLRDGTWPYGVRGAHPPRCWRTPISAASGWRSEAGAT